MAPEQYREEKGSDKSDIYAFGCVLYTICTGSPPWSELNHFQISKKNLLITKHPFSDKNVRIKIEETDIKDIIKKCLVFDYTERSNTEDIYSEMKKIWTVKGKDL